MTRWELRCIGLAVLLLLSGCGRTLQLSLSESEPVQLVTFHTDPDGNSRSREIVLQPDRPECARLREWVAHNQRGWSQSLATNPGGGIVVHAGKLSLQFVDGAVFAWTDEGQFQKEIREQHYAFLKKPAGI